jgi:hypothetical protein
MNLAYHKLLIQKKEKVVIHMRLLKYVINFSEVALFYCSQWRCLCQIKGRQKDERMLHSYIVPLNVETKTTKVCNLEDNGIGSLSCRRQCGITGHDRNCQRKPTCQVCTPSSMIIYCIHYSPAQLSWIPKGSMSGHRNMRDPNTSQAYYPSYQISGTQPLQTICLLFHREELCCSLSLSQFLEAAQVLKCFI